MLMFQLFKIDDGLLGSAREYWHRYLLHDELPIGVVSGPANVMPREWQRAWRACWAGDERLMSVYLAAFSQFEAACRFERGTDKMQACLKHALKLEGVIESDLVAKGTPELSEGERRQFADRYFIIKEQLKANGSELWTTRR
jgi:dihydrodipicolinate synthase/N-acetylneuraminate lyase